MSKVIPRLSDVSDKMMKSLKTMEQIGRASVIVEAVEMITRDAISEPAFVRFLVRKGDDEEHMDVCIILTQELNMLLSTATMSFKEINGGEIIIPDKDE